MERRIVGLLDTSEMVGNTLGPQLRIQEQLQTDGYLLRALMESYGIDVRDVTTVPGGLSVVKKASILIAAGANLNPFDHVLEAALRSNTPVYNFHPAPVELRGMHYQLYGAVHHQEVWYDPTRAVGLQLAFQTLMSEDPKIKSALGRVV